MPTPVMKAGDNPRAVQWGHVVSLMKKGNAAPAADSTQPVATALTTTDWPSAVETWPAKCTLARAPSLARVRADVTAELVARLGYDGIAEARPSQPSEPRHLAGHLVEGFGEPRVGPRPMRGQSYGEVAVAEGDHRGG